ncbi:cobalt-factor II C(20)-methyltransferase [Mangrovibacter yixingensis]|uniref:cobalt-factor II C(20)-methyltransferase n=1 Tax=Mangrovibacter yixingensis TaxID=1529639 RepID=UPI001CFB39B9|nr:cobalt-factor II C(20)-methyltransferase [Mangrovibacter yixingensis]
MSGRLYAISTGPGASDLITVRAARILGKLDCLYAPAGRKGADSLALSIVRPWLSEKTEIHTCHFPMSADNDAKAAVWDEVAGTLAREAQAGKQVGFITLGDAMLFSTWVWLLARLGRPDWLEIVPGVTSVLAIASAAALPLAMDQQSLAIVACNASEQHLRDTLQRHDCVVMMKVYGRFPAIKALLQECGVIDHAVMMAEATLPGERCWRDLSAVPDDESLPYFSTILVNKQWDIRSESWNNS